VYIKGQFRRHPLLLYVAPNLSTVMVAILYFRVICGIQEYISMR